MATGAGVLIEFDRDVSASLQPSDLKILDAQTNSLVHSSQASVVWKAETNQAEFSTSGIPRGQYLLVLGGVTNSSGVALDGDANGTPGGEYRDSIIVSWEGDTDLDGDVDFLDFLVLSAHFGRTGAVWSLGDFNGDGTVSFYDFLQLSSNFGKRIG